MKTVYTGTRISLLNEAAQVANDDYMLISTTKELDYESKKIKYRNLLKLLVANISIEILTDMANSDIELAYDSETNYLKLRSKSDPSKTFSEGVDMSAFLKDGMIDNVTYSSLTLHFVFNSDSGKKPIDIKLSDLGMNYTGGNGISISNNVIQIDYNALNYNTLSTNLKLKDYVLTSNVSTTSADINTGTSTTKVQSAKSVHDYVDAAIKSTSLAIDTETFSNDNTRVPSSKLVDSKKQDKSNMDTTLTGLSNDDTRYPSSKLVAGLIGLLLTNVYVYCSPTGNDTTGDGTKAKPFFSLWRAAEHLQLYRANKNIYYIIQLVKGSNSETTFDYGTASRNKFVTHPDCTASGSTLLIQPEDSSTVFTFRMEIYHSEYYWVNHLYFSGTKCNIKNCIFEGYTTHSAAIDYKTIANSYYATSLILARNGAVLNLNDVKIKNAHYGIPCDYSSMVVTTNIEFYNCCCAYSCMSGSNIVSYGNVIADQCSIFINADSNSSVNLYPTYFANVTYDFKNINVLMQSKSCSIIGIHNNKGLYTYEQMKDAATYDTEGNLIKGLWRISCSGITNLATCTNYSTAWIQDEMQADIHT